MRPGGPQGVSGDGRAEGERVPGRVCVGKAAGVTLLEAQGTLCRLSSRRSGLMDPSHLSHTHAGLGTRVLA